MSETRDEFVDEFSTLAVEVLDDERSDAISERIEFRMDDGGPRFDEPAFIELCTEMGAELIHELPCIKPRPGFSSTIQEMSLDDLADLAKEVVCQMGAKILIHLCDRADGKLLRKQF